MTSNLGIHSDVVVGNWKLKVKNYKFKLFFFLIL